ncbi:MAG: hydroxymethylbilane synthase [Micropepsaceae bacterium]
MQTRLRIGTRGSKLALTQTNMVIAMLARTHGWSADEAAAKTEVVVIKTTGDAVQDRPLADIGGKGLFAKEIEEAMLEGKIDCAVHSLKDLPAVMPEGLILGGHLEREDPRDAFVSRTAKTIHDLPEHAIFGTSSVRRRAMLLNLRGDLEMIDFRGNVDTRLRKLDEGQAQATVLALAGLKRLGLAEHATSVFTHDEMLPAVAQGAVGIELRENDAKTRDVIAAADHRDTAIPVAFERAFQAALGGSCRTPIAGYANWSDPRTLSFKGSVLSRDGRTRFDVTRTVAAATTAEAAHAGDDAGRELLGRAGRSFLEE